MDDLVKGVHALQLIYDCRSFESCKGSILDYKVSEGTNIIMTLIFPRKMRLIHTPWKDVLIDVRSDHQEGVLCQYWNSLRLSPSS